MDNKENFIFESKHNPFELTNEKSAYAENQIDSAIAYLNDYLKADKFNVDKKYTYEISIPSGRKIKIASFKTVFFRGDEFCTVEVSNPYEFKGSRYWTFFKDRGGFWTDKDLLELNAVNSDIVFNLLAKNYDWIYKKVQIINKQVIDGEMINADESLLYDVDYSPAIEDESFSGREDLAFKIFQKVFKK